jgi:hypothetical protein
MRFARSKDPRAGISTRIYSSSFVTATRDSSEFVPGDPPIAYMPKSNRSCGKVLPGHTTKSTRLGVALLHPLGV